MTTLAEWDELKDNLPTNHADAAEAMYDMCDRLADLAERALRERDQAVEALRKVRAEGMNNFNTRCKPWWKSICTTLASIEGTGHE